MVNDKWKLDLLLSVKWKMNENDDVDDWKQKREMKWCTLALRRE